MLIEPGSGPSGGNTSTWGTVITLDATSLTGGHAYTISSLGGEATGGRARGQLVIFDNQNNPNGGNNILVFDSLGNFGIGTSAPSTRLQVSNGDIYIDKINNGVIMKSPNGQCWRGTLNNTGNLGFSQIDCPIADTTRKTTLTKELKVTDHVVVYPNPSENSITIGIDNYKGDLFTAIITNSSGQIVSKKIISSNVTTINNSNLINGMYFLSINDKNGNSISSNKIIKE